jgi:hypothetical protein
MNKGFPNIWGCSSPGRALDWQSRGKGFDPPHLHQKRHSFRQGEVMSFFSLL